MSNHFFENERGSDNGHYAIQSAHKTSVSEVNSLFKVDPFGSEKDFQRLVRRYFEEELMGLSPLTIKAQKQDLQKFLLFFKGINNHLNASEWLLIDSKLFIEELKKQEYAPASINRILATIRSFGRWVRDMRIITHDPCRKIKEFQLAPLQPKRIDDLSYHRLMKTADSLSAGPQNDYSQHFRNRTMMLLLNNSGLRIHEILGLKIWQYQAIGKKLIKVHCKGGKIREVRISKECCEKIEEYLKAHRTQGSDYIFTNRYGKRLSRNGIAKALHRISGIANTRLNPQDKIHVTPHRFRHRHAYNVRLLKGDSFAAQRLGHSSLAYIGRYATPDNHEEEDLLERV
jgi:integrase/recombinase XerD